MAKGLNKSTAQIEAKIGFSADVTQAKRAINDLQNSLQKLANTKLGSNFDSQLEKAADSAAELSYHLKQATNVDTGNLDFAKLNQSITKSGKSISEYSNQLLKLGPDGVKAFGQLTRAISDAEIPLRRTNKAAVELGNVLKNTIRWQISSSSIHAFMGAIQSAYGYAQDLNESLNKIRIVTGQNIDQMDRFADRANKAAQALSTSTLEYTKASLIYYQQGLSDEEVQARTDVTVKMANVTGNTAEKVSQQLTAVWNNYAKGAENLEYFADVMTALGAATASSSDEISQGLEKFAAIGQTVGLSYEYAAAALATVTATTRQSADVVGNAFKTLFARLEGLKLGDTLEDGTDLNKYSKALLAVGVNIKDVNGDMKDMDTILDELASKWNMLGQDQQMALAQTVAGVRQYTQLIALMNNWDFMQKNIKTAKDSTGTLQKQNEIYAESWEAASKRVQAALESIYTKLINDDFFIDILNFTEKLINFVDRLITGLGGLPGLLTTISTILLQKLGPQMQQGLKDMSYSLSMMTAGGREKIANQKAWELQQLSEAAYEEGQGYETKASATKAQSLSLEITAQKQLIQEAEHLSDIELEIRKTRIQRLRQLNDEAIKLAEMADAAEEERTKALAAVQALNQEITGQKLLNAYNQQDSFSALRGKALNGENVYGSIVDFAARLNLDPYAQGNSAEQAINNLLNGLQDGSEDIEDLFDTAWNEIERIILTGGQEISDELRQRIDEYQTAMEQADAASGKVDKAMQRNKEHADKISASYGEAAKKQVDWTQSVTQGAQALTSLASVMNITNGIMDTWSNKTTTFGQKMLSTISSVGMALPTLISGINAGATALTNLGVAANVANPIMAILSALVLLATVVIKKVQESREKQKQLLEDNLQKAKENLDAQEQERAEAVSLYSAYEKLRAIQDTTAQGKQDLADAALKAAQALKIENAELLIASGRYKELDIAMTTARRRELEESYKNNEAALGASLAVALNSTDSATKNMSSFFQGNNLKFFFGDQANSMALSNRYGLDLFNTENTGEIFANIDTTDPQALLSFYNQLVQIQTDLNNGSLEAKDYLNVEGINEFIEAFGTYVPELQQYVDTRHELAAGNAVEQELKNYKNGITTLQDYNTIEEKVIANLEKENYSREEATEKAREYFNTLGYGKLVSESTVLSQYSQSSGISMGSLLGLSEEQRRTMLAIDPNSVKGDFSELLALINHYGVIGQYSTAQTSAAKYTAAAGAIKEGQTQAEIDAALAEAGLTLGEEERQEFYRKTYEERVVWLEKMARAEVDKAKESGQEIEEIDLDTLNARKANLETARDTALGIGQLDLAQSYQEQIDGIQRTIDTLNEQQAQAQTDSIFRAQQLAEVYDSILTSDVDIGDKVSADFAEKLSAIGVDISKYLVPNDDGTYSLVISGAEFREEAFNELVDKFDKLNPEEKIQVRKVLAENVTSIEQFDKLVNKAVFNTKQLSSIWEQMIRKLKAKDLDTTKLEDFADHLQEIASAANKVDRNGLAASLATDAEAAEKVAVSILNMQDGYEALSNSWDTWKKQLGPEKDKTSDEYATALANVKEAIADLINVNADQISTSFAESVFGDLDGVAKGQFEKIDDIRTKYFEDTRDKILHNLEDETKTDLTNLFDLLQQELEQNPLEVGSALDLTSFLTGINGMEQSWVQTLTEMIAAGKISVNQLSSMFAGLGIDIVPVYGALEGPNVGQFMQAMNNAAAAAASGDYMAAMAASQVANSLVANKQVVQTVTGWRFVKTGDTASLTPQTPKTTGGGGSSKSKADKTVSQKTEADRYHYIREQLSDLERAYAAAGKAKDKAFGDERLRYLDQEIELTDQLIDKQDEYLAEINDYMEKAQGDRDALLASGFVTEADLDDNGLIKNWDAIWREINKAREKAVSDYNRDKDNENIDAEGNYKAATEKIDEAERRLKQYEETLNLWEQEQEKRVDLLRQKQELAFERTSYILDINLKLTENDIKAINFQYDLLKDNLYKAVEAMQLLVGANYDAFNSGEMHKYLNELGYVKDNYEDLVSLWNQDIGLDTNGNVLHAISQADFIDGLQNNIDTIYDKLKEILNLDKEMFEYYSNTLAKSNEEIARYRDQMNAISSAMQHWKSILDLTSKTHKDYYKQLDAILKGQRDMAGNDYAVSKQRYEDLLEEQKHAEEALAGATGERERELLQHNLDAINEQVRDAWEKMLSDAENYAQKAKDVLVNALEMAADEAEDILTHGMGFDQLNDSMDRISSNQDEYLTKTNQLYEMNQMLRQLQQDSDKANNQAAKTRIANFTKEMEDLRDKNQLSKLDLDIAKARYEVLLAEIALEDAQNAKSVVRLQRDNEGNFGYVYTADGNDIAKAQDDLAKKQNDLYNIVLNGTNDYGQKMIQLNQQYLEKLKEINEKYTEENGFTEQERQAAILQATEEFNRLRQTYEEQYTTAMYWLNETASTDTSEAWVNAYQDIIENGQEWHDATTTYLSQVDAALDEFNSVADVVTQEVGENYDETKQKVDDLTEAHDTLANKLENEVLDAVYKVESAVQEATEVYAANRDRVYEMVAAYQALIREMQAYQQLAAMENFDAASDDYDSSLDYSKLMAEAFKAGHTAEIQKYAQYRDRKTGELGLSDADLAGKGWQTTKDILTALNDQNMSYDEKLDWLRKHLYLPGFATGGYTGEWGSTGRLALLHEKELVLNQEDTENLLNAVSMVRGISSFIEGQARAAAGSVGFSIPGLSGGGSFEQTVTIHAEFPNVTDHNEIEEAFNNLRNRATQYANRS